jgi:hypothetical protein
MHAVGKRHAPRGERTGPVGQQRYMVSSVCDHRGPAALHPPVAAMATPGNQKLLHWFPPWIPPVRGAGIPPGILVQTIHAADNARKWRLSATWGNVPSCRTGTARFSVSPCDLPQPGQPVRLDNQEEDDQCAHDQHEVDVFHGRRTDIDAEVSGSARMMIGRIQMKAAPMKLPTSAPSPPMITMNRYWNEWLIESSPPRLRRARRTPSSHLPHRRGRTMTRQTPRSLAVKRATPISSAAISMSRIIIQDRPMRPRTRFLQSSVTTTTMTARRNTRHRRPPAPVRMMSPKPSRRGTSIAPEEL